MEKIIAVNSSDQDWTDHRYILGFGAYGWTRLMVWANSLQDALDESIDWIADHAPGLLCDDQVHEEFRRLRGQEPDENGQLSLPFLSEEEAMQEAEQDTTCGGNYGHYILSHEWCVIAEDPTREEILSLQAA
jgi:hypothetical protein